MAVPACDPSFGEQRQMDLRSSYWLTYTKHQASGSQTVRGSHPASFLASASIYMDTLILLYVCIQHIYREHGLILPSFLYALSSSLKLTSTSKASVHYSVLIELFPCWAFSLKFLRFPGAVLQTEACGLAGNESPFPIFICFCPIRLFLRFCPPHCLWLLVLPYSEELLQSPFPSTVIHHLESRERGEEWSDCKKKTQKLNRARYTRLPITLLQGEAEESRARPTLAT